ncbi:hypothetical protein TNIN_377001 [Trichonephila inaurata madagascariensis]|uniref:Uncharacterized protein n=1 Tax=Trichonephila inaurata madagascariensis TaxID=2747483 RepID=A0A8X7C165_9ARAC|nr:hypothetical protein TNIN_377001 [Trichonephila inaurata madagascariensis]
MTLTLLLHKRMTSYLTNSKVSSDTTIRHGFGHGFMGMGVAGDRMWNKCGQECTERIEAKPFHPDGHHRQQDHSMLGMPACPSSPVFSQECRSKGEKRNVSFKGGNINGATQRNTGQACNGKIQTRKL